jgi:hypothetical protein
MFHHFSTFHEWHRISTLQRPDGGIQSHQVNYKECFVHKHKLFSRAKQRVERSTFSAQMVQVRRSVWSAWRQFGQQHCQAAALVPAA